MLSIVAFVVALLVFFVLFFSGGEGKKFGRAFLRDELGGVGNRFAYGNVSNGLIERIIAALGFVSPFGVPVPASWSQATWFIDPQNVSGNASDSNSGIDAAHPVLSYTRGIVPKWGTNAPTLRQNTTFTWLSDQLDDSDPVIMLPAMVASVAVIQAPLDAAHRLHTGVIPGGVIAKNRAAAQLLTFDLGFAAPLGSLVHNITLDAYAWVYKNVGGTVFALSNPMRSLPPIVDNSSASSVTGPLADASAWVTGNAFEVFTPIGVNLVKLAPTITEFQSTPVEFPAQMQVYHVTATSPGGPAFNDAYIGNDVDLIECNFQSVLVNDAISDDQNIFYVNNFLAGGAFCCAGANPLTLMAAGVLTTAESGIASVSNWVLGWDAILQAVPDAPILMHKLILPVPPVFGLGAFYIEAAQGDLRFHGPWHFDPTNAAAFEHVSLVWGPGAFDTAGFARISYVPTAVATFLNTGGLFLNGAATARTISVAGVWSAAIAITAPNLDDAASLHGLAWNPGGSSYANGAA